MNRNYDSKIYESTNDDDDDDDNDNFVDIDDVGMSGVHYVDLDLNEDDDDDDEDDDDDDDEDEDADDVGIVNDSDIDDKLPSKIENRNNLKELPKKNNHIDEDEDEDEKDEKDHEEDDEDWGMSSASAAIWRSAKQMHDNLGEMPDLQHNEELLQAYHKLSTLLRLRASIEREESKIQINELGLRFERDLFLSRLRQVEALGNLNNWQGSYLTQVKQILYDEEDSYRLVGSVAFSQHSHLHQQKNHANVNVNANQPQQK